MRGLPIEIDSEVEVSRLPRTIDLLATAETSANQAQMRAKTPFQQISRYNQIEFKGQNDRLDVWDYLRIVARTSLYMGENKIRFDQMSVNIVCASTPRKVLENPYTPHVFEQIDDGRYQRPGYPQLTLIAINELPAIKRNYPLLMFASSVQKFRTFLNKVLSEGQLDYVYFAYHIQPQITEELMKMAGLYTLPRENLEFIAKDIGDELIDFLTLEQRLKGITAQERLEGITPQERLEGITPDQLVQTLDIDEMNQMIAEMRVKMVREKQSAVERIELLETFSDSDIELIQNEVYREQLWLDLELVEQEKIRGWIEARP